MRIRDTVIAHMKVNNEAQTEAGDSGDSSLLFVLVRYVTDYNLYTTGLELQSLSWSHKRRIYTHLYTWTVYTSMHMYTLLYTVYTCIHIYTHVYRGEEKCLIRDDIHAYGR